MLHYLTGGLCPLSPCPSSLDQAELVRPLRRRNQADDPPPLPPSSSSSASNEGPPPAEGPRPALLASAAVPAPSVVQTPVVAAEEEGCPQRHSPARRSGERGLLVLLRRRHPYDFILLSKVDRSLISQLRTITFLVLSDKKGGLPPSLLSSEISISPSPRSPSSCFDSDLFFTEAGAPEADAVIWRASLDRRKGCRRRSLALGWSAGTCSGISPGHLFDATVFTHWERPPAA